MKRTIVIVTVLALACGGAGFAVGAAAFARADDHTTTRTEVVRTVVAPTRAAPVPVAPPIVTPSTAPIARSTSTPRVPRGEADVRVRRLVVTRGIEARETIDEIDVLDRDEELDRVWAFVELANAGDASGAVTVTFERDGGAITGIVDLEVPARTGRWRTWAFSRGVTETGSWTAVVRDEDHRVLAEQDFEVR